METQSGTVDNVCSKHLVANKEEIEVIYVMSSDEEELTRGTELLTTQTVKKNKVLKKTAKPRTKTAPEPHLHGVEAERLHKKKHMTSTPLASKVANGVAVAGVAPLARDAAGRFAKPVTNGKLLQIGGNKGKSSTGVVKEKDASNLSSEQQVGQQGSDFLNEANFEISCRAMRIGSYSLHFKKDLALPVKFTKRSLKFTIPVVMKPKDMVTIKIRYDDVVSVSANLGKTFPILFIHTTQVCGESVRDKLCMVDKMANYFDPSALDETCKRITILLNSITPKDGDMCRQVFSKKIKLITLVEAREILAKSSSIPINPRKRIASAENRHTHIPTASKRKAPATCTKVEDLHLFDTRVPVNEPIPVVEENFFVHEDDELYECSCCYNNVYFDYLVQCREGHLFCCECLQRYTAESVFGSGKATLQCMTDGCTAQFPHSQLLRALPTSLQEKYENRIAEEYLNLAALPNFVRCPQCDTGAELDANVQFYACPNPFCRKVSCRFCKKYLDIHLGLQCDQVEENDETHIRVKYEERMAEAKIRECARCKARYTKEDGCNKITCRCSSTMCYICRVPNIDYKHFCQHVRSPTKKKCAVCNNCSLWSNAVQDEELAIAELKKEANTARANLGFEVQKEIGVPMAVGK